MVAVESTMLPLGTKAPPFELADHSGETWRSSEHEDAPALVVMFICNHCPYVKHIADVLATVTSQFMRRGVAVVAINSNDVAEYPDDGPQQMAEEARMRGYEFPYLRDESQAVAQAYRAACTPDFFVFDGDQRLVYRGQFCDARPANDVKVTGRDLSAAVDAVLSGQEYKGPQKPSIGCNIKWKPGNEPDYQVL